MIALDMDGTLLGADHRISSRALGLLQKLSEEGVLISLCTGRSTPAILEHVSQLKLSCPIPVVAFNGALGMSCTADGQTVPLYTAPVPAEVVAAVLKLADENGLLVQYYVGDDIYVVCKTIAHRELTYRYAGLIGVKAHVYVESYDEAIARGMPYKLLLMSDDVDAAYELLHKELPAGSAKLIRGTPPFFVEVLDPRVDKGVGLRRLCDALGVEPARVVAFGDGHNDLEFLQLAGLSYAMKNGGDAIKQVATRVTERSNAEDGVAIELERLWKQGALGSREPGSAVR